MKNILIINGNPVKESYSMALADAYRKGAEKSGAEIKMISLIDFDFGTPFLKDFKTPNDSEDLKKAQELIAWSHHIVWVYPTWWYLPPALVKAFIEHVFLPGFAFKYKSNPNRVAWDSYLTGKTTHFIATMDAPPFFYRLFIGNPGGKAMKNTMTFYGIKVSKQTYFGSLKVSDEAKRKKWLLETEKLGEKLI